MDHFYGHLAEGRQPAEALCQAKLDLIQEFGERAVPRLWAGFIIVGDVTKSNPNDAPPFARKNTAGE
jgi:CHAT domain-containing protein